MSEVVEVKNGAVLGDSAEDCAELFDAAKLADGFYWLDDQFDQPALHGPFQDEASCLNAALWDLTDTAENYLQIFEGREASYSQHAVLRTCRALLDGALRHLPKI